MSAAIIEHSQASNRIPGPAGHFLLGNLAEFRRDPLGLSYRAFQRYGDLFRLQLGPQAIMFASHPALAQEILINQRENFARLEGPRGQPEGLQLVLGNGLVTNTDEAHWLVQRRMIQPMFHRRQLLKMSGTMVAAGQRLIARWDSHFEAGSTLDVAREMMRVTLDIINQTMFSADVLNRIEQIGPAVSTAAHFAFQHATRPLRPPLSWPTPANRHFRDAMEMLDNLVYSLIEKRRASGERFDDLLDMLLEARDEETGKGMDDRQLRDEVLTIFAAGHETTSNALSWTWYLLSEHPDVRQRLQDEVDTVLGDRTLRAGDLENLPFVRAVFEEALRLCPPVTGIPRQAIDDTTVGGFPIKRGERVLVSIRNIHRHPGFWEEPEAFRPERFLPGHPRPDHRLAFMPFGAGPHLCLGNHLALIEGTLLLALISQRYTLDSEPEHPVEAELAVTMRPKHGLRMRISRR